MHRYVAIAIVLAAIFLPPPAQAGRKQILRAIGKMTYANNVTLSLPPGECNCAESECDDAQDLGMSCGGGGLTADGLIADNVRLTFAQPGVSDSGIWGCQLCACNLDPAAVIDVKARILCLDIP